MYIRRTQTRSNATGEPYFTYRLVRSERIDGKVKQVTLLNLGRHFAVDPSRWPALCVRIDELLAGQARLVEIDLPKSAAVEADRIVEQLQLHKPRLFRRRRLQRSLRARRKQNLNLKTSRAPMSKQ